MDRRKFLKILSTVPVINSFTSALSKSKSGDQMRKLTQQPSYLKLHKSGELKKRAQELWSIMEDCTICPRECEANRLDGEEGFCGATSKLEIASFNPHFGEEDPLVGSGGSGTIFLTHCSLRCVFCINPDISQGGQGRERSIAAMAKMMLKLQEIGCLNINIVTPTHYLPHMIMALDKAAKQGLEIPLVYNTSGYEKYETIKKLDGIVDIYLPDFKYSEGRMAKKYSSGAEKYPKFAKKAVLEMNRQVGVAKPNQHGIMEQGLMIRHLVMPNNVSGTRMVLKWISENLPSETYLNIMSQYRPMYKAHNYPDIDRRLARKEYKNAVDWAREFGLTNLEIQGY